jgi:hypothetical protein
MQIPPIGNTPQSHGMGGITPAQKAQAQGDISNIKRLLEMYMEQPQNRVSIAKQILTFAAD